MDDGKGSFLRPLIGRTGRMIPTSFVLLLLLACSACGPRLAPPPIGNRQQAITATPASGVSSPPAPTIVTPVETRCAPSLLQLSLGDPISEPTGQHSLALTLTNRSDATCVLFGYPTVTLLAGQGTVLPFDYRHAGDQVVTGRLPTRVVVPPGVRAYVTINQYRCDLGVRGQVTIVRLTPPADSTPLQLALTPADRSLGYCGPGDPGSVLAVSPVASTFLDTMAHS